MLRSRPREVVGRELPPTNVGVEIRVGNVLEQSGNVIVGVADTFDTQFENNNVISRHSVQGQLLADVFHGDRKL